jgi:hypothetical protein
VHRGDVLDRDVAPPCPHCPVLPVRLFGIKEEVLVESADGLERCGIHQQHRADHVPRLALHETAQLHRVGQKLRRLRVRPGDLLVTAVGIDLRRADRRYHRLRVKGLVQTGDHLGADDGIGVEQQHIGTGQAPTGQRVVDAAAESEVGPGVPVGRTGFASDPFDLGHRGVVHHRHREVADGGERLADQVGRAVGDDDDLDSGFEPVDHRIPHRAARLPGLRGPA